VSERVELPTVEERCGTCRFWDWRSWLLEEYRESAVGPHPGQSGDCRRYPPDQWVAEDQEYVHPSTSEGRWCGEWQAKRTV
jgi:hypothetical protein